MPGLLRILQGLSSVLHGCHSRLDATLRSKASSLRSTSRESRIRLKHSTSELDSRVRGNDIAGQAFHRLGAIVFAALLLLGASVRIYGAWQLRHNLNPDSGTVALMAKHIAEGKDFPVFFYGQAYMGSLEPLVSALFCALFGTSGFMVTLGTAFVGWLVLLAVFIWARDAHSPAAGLAAVAYCIIGPSGFAHYQVSPRGGYAVTILFSALILWLISKLIAGGSDKCHSERSEACPSSARESLPKLSIWRRSFVPSYRGIGTQDDRACGIHDVPHDYGLWFLLGIIAGLGWWSNQLIVGAIFTAAVMALFFLRGEIFSFNTLSAAIGFFIGSLPFWWWNALHDWQSFAFAGSLGQTSFTRGLMVFFWERLPDLLDLNHGISLWRIAGAAVYLGAAVFFTAFLWKTLKIRQGKKQVYLLTAFVFILVSALIFSTSHFALMNTSRYLLPLVPVVAVIFGVMTAELTKRKYFFLGVIPLVLVVANQAVDFSWLSARGRGEDAYQRQIEECGRFLQSQQIHACYVPYGKYSWNFALREEICFCDLPYDRYPPYVRRAELADRVAVFDNFGDINNFIACYGGSAKLYYSGSTPVCYGFTAPGDGLAFISPDDVGSIRDSLEHDILAEVTDANIDTGWEGVADEGDDEWLEIDFKTPQTVRMIRLLYSEYPATWQIAGQGEDGLWKTLTPCVQTAGYLWSGPRPYWSFGLEGYRLECKIPPEKLKRMRIHRIESGYHLLEMQLFGPAVAPEREESALKNLMGVIRARNLKRLYCDRWPANAVFRETQGAVETWLNSNVFGDCSLATNNTIWFTPRTAILVRGEDALMCRQTLASRMVEMRPTKIGPWVLFDFSPCEALGRSMGKPGKWKPEYGRDFELYWAGFTCLTKNSKRWAAELISRADLCQLVGKKSEAISPLKIPSCSEPVIPAKAGIQGRFSNSGFPIRSGMTNNKSFSYNEVRQRADCYALLQKACAAWPLYLPAVERLVKITTEQGKTQDAEYWKREYEKLQPEIRADIKFGDGIEFAGLSLSTNIVSVGDSLTVRYFWKYPPDGVKGKPWVFVHFLSGPDILQDDHPLEKFRGSEYQPFPEVFVETRRFFVSKTAPEGEYQVRIGLYDAAQAKQKRFTVKTALPSRLNSVELPVKLIVKGEK